MTCNKYKNHSMASFLRSIKINVSSHYQECHTTTKRIKTSKKNQKFQAILQGNGAEALKDHNLFTKIFKIITSAFLQRQ